MASRHRGSSAPSLRQRAWGIAVGAVTARATFEVLAAADPPAWRRRNYRGAELTLAAGPALIAGAIAGAIRAKPATAGSIPAKPASAGRDLAALLVAVGSAALTGGYDDAYGSSGARGLSGHLSALRTGAVTTGMVKVAGIGAGAVVTGYLLDGSRYDIAVNAGLVAGSANLLNLLDLRPGRAAKVALLTGGPMLARSSGWPAAGAIGAAAGLLGVDLGEHGMLGDAGANVLGAALGVALAATGGRWTRTLSVAAIGALNLASERVSFTAVIEATRPLRWLDRLGRTP